MSNQPRDEKGRWTSGNGPKSPSPSKPVGTHAQAIADLPKSTVKVSGSTGGKMSPALAALLGTALGAGGAMLRGINKRH
jgi:hypothetical protein